MSSLVKPPTKVPANQAVQYALHETEPGSGVYYIKTSPFSGSTSVEIDSTEDSITIGDESGRKAEINGSNELKTHDAIVVNKMDALIEKISLKPLVDYDSVNMTLSSGDTVETYVFKLGLTTIATLVVSFTDNTRKVLTSMVWS